MSVQNDYKLPQDISKLPLNELVDAKPTNESDKKARFIALEHMEKKLVEDHNKNTSDLGTLHDLITVRLALSKEKTDEGIVNINDMIDLQLNVNQYWDSIQNIQKYRP